VGREIVRVGQIGVVGVNVWSTVRGAGLKIALVNNSQFYLQYERNLSTRERLGSKGNHYILECFNLFVTQNRPAGDKMAFLEKVPRNAMGAA
jgi:hypothetical protein